MKELIPMVDTVLVEIQEEKKSMHIGVANTILLDCIQLASYDEIRTEVMEDFSNALVPMEFTLDVRQTPVRETLSDKHNKNFVVQSRLFIDVSKLSLTRISIIHH